MIYVLYHKNCMDGKAAAYAAWKKLGDHNTTYIEVDYGEPVPEMLDVTEIYILDFSYSKEVLLELNNRAKVVVLDHHKTAQKDLEGIEFAKFDMNKSGARLAWEHFHPNKLDNDHILFTEDRDLWNWKLSYSKQYSLGAYTYIKNFRDFDEVTSEFLIDSGHTIEYYQDQLLKSILNNSYLTNFENSQYKVAIVNSPVLQSELGNALLNKYPEADFSYVFREDENNVYVSLRSEDSRADVSIIAKSLGGGGHRNASGYVIKKESYAD